MTDYDITESTFARVINEEEVKQNKRKRPTYYKPIRIYKSDNDYTFWLVSIITIILVWLFINKNNS